MIAHNVTLVFCKYRNYKTALLKADDIANRIYEPIYIIHVKGRRYVELATKKVVEILKRHDIDFEEIKIVEPLPF